MIFMIIEELKSHEEVLWDKYVKKHKESCFFHLIGCKKLIENVCHYKSIYLTAKTRDKIIGILPLFLVNRWFHKKCMVSIPYSVCGGVCVDSEEIEIKLINRAIELTQSLNVDYLELRHHHEKCMNLTTRKTYSTFILDLADSQESIWKGMRKSMRRAVKKSINNNLEIDFTSKDIDEFYYFYAKDQLKFGTPVQGTGWIKGLFSHFPDNHFIARVRLGDKNIAMFLVRRFKDTVSEIIGNDLPEYRYLNPNLALEWKLIENALQDGYQKYDFGRSIIESGTYFFKMGWGAKPHTLSYQYYLNKTRSIPDTSQANPKRILFAKIWRKLPFKIANTLGPMIRRHYP